MKVFFYFLSKVELLEEKRKENPRGERERMEDITLTLGKKTKLNEILEMVGHALVRRFPSRRMSPKTPKDWTKTNFSPLIDHSPQDVILVRGWIVWTLRSMGEVEDILHRRWRWGAKPLF
jgi:hypothetical protein